MRYALLLLTGCWTSAPVAAPAPEAPSAFEITLERHACFGVCPVYTVSIDGDGRVHWMGHDHVQTVGARRATVAPKRVAEIERMLETVQFFARDVNGEIPRVDCTQTGSTKSCSFQDSVICSDSGTVTLTVRNAHRTHTVRNDHCEPSPLDELEALIDDVARTTAWIHKRVSD